MRAMEDKEKTVSVASLRALSPVLTRTWEGHLREGVGQEGGGFAVSAHSAERNFAGNRNRFYSLVM